VSLDPSSTAPPPARRPRDVPAGSADRPVTSEPDQVSSGRILVGVDDSSESEAAIRWALRFAAATSGAVHVLHAWHLADEYSWVSPRPSPDDPAVIARQEIATMVDAARTATGIDDATVPVTVTVVTGRAVPTLLDAARDADLVVVGRRGGGGFAGLLLGSVSAQLAAHAPCPVTIVRTDTHTERAEPGVRQ
jgi:nucleotide-binding universal stress UspA family protein